MLCACQKPLEADCPGARAGIQMSAVKRRIRKIRAGREVSRCNTEFLRERRVFALRVQLSVGLWKSRYGRGQGNTVFIVVDNILQRSQSVCKDLCNLQWDFVPPQRLIEAQLVSQNYKSNRVDLSTD